jgi:nucleoside-diphosphate-sugar epimerase
VKALVTGAAGFVGSHLCELLVEHGDEVLAVDCYTEYYERSRKERNLSHALSSGAVELIEADLANADVPALLEGVEVVYHLAGQPGVRPSWGRDFDTYVHHNVLATQSLLEACRERPLRKFVYASSSSVYGDAEEYPTAESLRPRPVSPYGVTKLAAEHLCELYRTNFGLPTASLRLFTVYGPRQRPDMAFSRLIAAATGGRRFELYGDGEQTRDFTFVGDVVRAMRQAALSGWSGVANIGGGSRTSMANVIATVAEIAGRSLEVEMSPDQPGDVRHTAADITVAAEGFGYAPRTSLREGLRVMFDWATAEDVLAG